MNKQVNLLIWDREFSIAVDYDCFEDEEILETQTEALKIFLGNQDWIAKSKAKVEEYCRTKVNDDAENDKKDNIFSYIKPDYLFIKQEKGVPRVALMCKYRYDVEHGLAVIFTSEGKITVGSQDDIL